MYNSRKKKHYIGIFRLSVNCMNVQQKHKKIITNNFRFQFKILPGTQKVPVHIFLQDKICTSLYAGLEQ